MAVGKLQIYPLTILLHEPELNHLWQKVVREIGDVYYQLAYLQVAALNEEGEILLGIYQHPEGIVIYPFVQRPLNKLNLNAAISGANYDIITPFEYGGALIQTANPQNRSILQAEFHRALTDYCHSQGIVSEFVRFHPLLKVDRDWEKYYNLRHNCANIIIDLTKTPAEIFAEYHRHNRRDVRLALRRGVQIEKVANTPANFQQFAAIYYPTMDKHQAKPFYYFSSAYFEALANLKDDLIALYFAKDSQENIVSAAIFLIGDRFVHYHLSATVPGASKLCSVNLLLHNVILEMQQAGKQYLHLLGAPAAQPSLLAFKSKFSGDRANYYVGTKIYNLPAYNALCTAWKQTYPQKDAPANFFPLYRAN